MRKIYHRVRKHIASLFIIIIIVSSVFPPPVYAQEASASANVATQSADFVLPSPATGAADMASPSSVIGELILPTPSVSLPSAIVRQPSRLQRLPKHHFTVQESVELIVENDGADDPLTVEASGPNGKVTLPMKRTRTASGLVLAFLPPPEFVPGKYTVTVIDSLGTVMTEEFSWGVLAINTNKSVYTPGEQATIAMAILDEMGRMVCDAQVTLEITDPSSKHAVRMTQDGSIIVNTQCQRHDVSTIPDYETRYPVGGSGTYHMTLTAVTKNGTNTITDQFDVRDWVPFSVERKTATRIYPPHTYPVTVEITANEDFTGTVTETVPASFTVSQLEGVTAYHDIRLGYESLTAARDVVHIMYPFSGQYRETLGFGDRVEDRGLRQQYRDFGLLGHDGVDFSLPENTPVLAADSGRVELAGEGAYGTTIVLQHAWGRSYYGHLSQVLVQKDDTVQVGDRIGLSGHTGLSTGPHLHFGIRPGTNDMQNGYYGKIDPSLYFDQLATWDNAQHQYVSWNLSIKKGEKVTIGYQYKAPSVSPQLYRVGPLRFTDDQQSRPSSDVVVPFVPPDTTIFSESRQWQIAADATFQIATGYYIGTGTDNFAITGVGFQPDLVIIKDDTGNGTDGANWKSSSMAGEVSSVLSDGDADTANNAIQSLDSDGFTLGTDADVNTANVRFVWTAFGGSDCTSSGTFCVGSYTGDGAATHALTSVGFAPNYVAIKQSGLTTGVFKTSSMATNVSQTFDANNESTNGTNIKTLDATGFTVGNAARVNSNGVTYWFYAFKTTSGAFAEGTYTGNGTDNTAVTVGFQPDYAMVKLANGTAASAPVFNQQESDSDYSGSILDLANSTGWIKSLDSNGFTVGSAAPVNENTKTLYWVAFGGAPAPAGSGTYTMKVGSYTGNGTSQSITGVGFQPDLVMIKDSTAANYGVFRTSLMKGDSTAYFANGVVNFTGGITSLDSGGFSVGANATVNTNTTTYYYIAFDNAYNPEDKSGASDFVIGAYTGSGGDSRNILNVPFQPNLVALKAETTTLAVWRTSTESGDNSLVFSTIAESADYVQALNGDGFQVGTNGRVNAAGAIHWYFAFKTGSFMTVNSYSGTGSAQNITTPGFSPDLVWVKSAGATNGVLSTSSIGTDSTLYFANSAAVTDRITGMISNGFSIGGNQTETNTSATTYYYAAWKVPVTGPTNDQLMRHGNWFNGGIEQSFTF